MGMRERLPQSVAEDCTTKALFSAWHSACYLVSSQSTLLLVRVEDHWRVKQNQFTTCNVVKIVCNITEEERGGGKINVFPENL